jgi:hypothetical protein
VEGAWVCFTVYFSLHGTGIRQSQMECNFVQPPPYYKHQRCDSKETWNILEEAMSAGNFLHLHLSQPQCPPLYLSESFFSVYSS